MKKSQLPVRIGKIFDNADVPKILTPKEREKAGDAITKLSSQLKTLEELPIERRLAIESAEIFILFRAGSENSGAREYFLFTSDAPKLVFNLKSVSAEVAFDTTSRPGFPYYEMLVAMIPAGTGLAIAKLLADIFLEWLRGKNGREIEIRLKNGASIKLKGPNATTEEALALLQQAERSLSDDVEKVLLPTELDV